MKDIVERPSINEPVAQVYESGYNFHGYVANCLYMRYATILLYYDNYRYTCGLY